MSEAASDPFNPPFVEWRRLQPQLVTVRLLGIAGRGVPFILGCLIVYLFWRSPLVLIFTGGVVVFFIVNAILTPRRVRAIGYAVRDRDLFKQSGLLNRRLTIVPYVRIQYVDIHVGPIERLFGLATLSVSTAAPALAAVIPGLTPEIAAWLRDILTDKKNLTGRTQDFPADQPIAVPPASYPPAVPAMPYYPMQPPPGPTLAGTGS